MGQSPQFTRRFEKRVNYVIGIDYGTLSGRALLADAKGGKIASAVYEYPTP
jgi:ribulose kinase